MKLQWDYVETEPLLLYINTYVCIILTFRNCVLSTFALACVSCSISADVGDIQCRLLDHRPVINAEIRYFVKEFEVVCIELCRGTMV